MRAHQILSSCLVLALSLPTVGQQRHAQHAQVELLADKSAASPGQSLLLGVRFQLEKGWHIYWRNPGDSGQPADFQWQVPSGAIVRPIQWPYPAKLQHGEFADFGYENEAMLLAPLHVPANLRGTLEIGLQAKWLICREICIPDHAQFHLSLPQATTPVGDPAHDGLFSQARKLIPKPWPMQWNAYAASEKDSFVLSVVTGKKLSQAQFFPLAPNQVENAAPQQLRSTSTGAVLSLKKSEQLLKPINRLDGVLVIAGTAYQVQAPVTTR
jgi:DsbC/DsbD-like thiol-disulfide interchange protein